MTATSLGGEITNFKNKRLGINEEFEPAADYLIIHLHDQIFGIPVLQIQDVLGAMDVTKVPRAPKEVAGALNLRGRIVTAINVRHSIGLPDYDGAQAPLSVVVEMDNELYSLIIDRVGDVISIKDQDIESNPPTLDSTWKDISTGIYKSDERLMLILDVPRLLESI